MKNDPSLHPVILSVPATARRLPPRDLVAFLGRHARRALSRSAAISGLDMGEPLKAEDGRPLPANGVYWSLTHKPCYVAAVVSRGPIGIDVERIKERKTAAIFDKVADPTEWALFGDRSWEGFYRYWTAKEAVLKAEGTGLRGLTHCRVIEIQDECNLIIQVDNRRFSVEHYRFNNHMASIVKSDGNVCWTIVDSE